MKDMNDCVNFAEIDTEFLAGQKRLRELLNEKYQRQQQGDNRISYTGLKELIEAMEVDKFILENTEDFRTI